MALTKEDKGIVKKDLKAACRLAKHEMYRLSGAGLFSVWKIIYDSDGLDDKYRAVRALQETVRLFNKTLGCCKSDKAMAVLSFISTVKLTNEWKEEAAG